MTEDQQLKRKVVTGSFWVFGANLISRSISLLSTFILMRLLTPDDFGVIGYGFLIVSAIGLIREMGFNSALIYQKDHIETAASASLWFITLWSIFLYTLVFLMAPLAAEFFREPRLTILLRVLTLSLIFNSCASVPMSLMERDINFKHRVIPEVANLTMYGISTAVFALLGFQYWSFVIGVLSADILQLVVAFILRPVKLRFKLEIPLLRRLFGFGKKVMSLGILNFGIRNVDDFFVGRMLGTVPMGVYQLAYRMANIPATNITNVLGKVLYPGFMKIADDLEKLKNGFIRSFRYVTFITVPLTIYIVLITPDVVRRFFPHWNDAILPIQLIAYFGGLRSIGSGLGSIFLAKGKPQLLIPISLFQMIFLSALLYPTIHFWGLIGVCILVNLSMTLSFLWTFIKAGRIIALNIEEILRVVAFPILVSFGLWALIFGLSGLGGPERIYLSMAVKIIVYPVLYLLLGWFFSATPRQLIADLFQR